MAPPITVRYVPAHKVKNRSLHQILGVVCGVWLPLAIAVAVDDASRPPPDLCGTWWGSVLVVANLSNDSVAMRVSVTGSREEGVYNRTFAINAKETEREIDLHLPQGRYLLNLSVDPIRTAAIEFAVGPCNLEVAVRIGNTWLTAIQYIA